MCSRRFGRRGAGIWKKASVHTLRHTFGAHKADQHMSLATLQELMGHKKWARRRTSDNGGDTLLKIAKLFSYAVMIANS